MADPLFKLEGILTYHVDLIANKTVDSAFADQAEWVKKSIITVAKVFSFTQVMSFVFLLNKSIRWGNSVLTEPLWFTLRLGV